MSMGDSELRIFRVIAWVGDNPGERGEILAHDVIEAKELALKKYGNESTLSIWNEEDAEKPR